MQCILITIWILSKEAYFTKLIFYISIKVEDDAFEGLQSLEYLDISDNKVLSLPAAALGRLPQLKRLKADYNRWA